MRDPNSHTIDPFDRMIGSLDGLPDVRRTRPATVRSVLPMLGQSQTVIVQTYRDKDRGDFIFVELVDGEGRARVVLPPKAADAIARQRESLTFQNRRAASREAAPKAAATLAAKGLKPFGRK